MIKSKGGSLLRAIFAVVGTISFLIGLYLLNQGNLLSATSFGIAGILMITISILPFIRKS
jgi:hypothetical protein